MDKPPAPPRRLPAWVRAIFSSAGDNGAPAVAAMPLYAKCNLVAVSSCFDQSWPTPMNARGGAITPSCSLPVPFTPVTRPSPPRAQGPGESPAQRRSPDKVAKSSWPRKNDLSSLHSNFVDTEYARFLPIPPPCRAPTAQFPGEMTGYSNVRRFPPPRSPPAKRRTCARSRAQSEQEGLLSLHTLRRRHLTEDHLRRLSNRSTSTPQPQMGQRPIITRLVLPSGERMADDLLFVFAMRWRADRSGPFEP